MRIEHHDLVLVGLVHEDAVDGRGIRHDQSEAIADEPEHALHLCSKEEEEEEEARDAKRSKGCLETGIKARPVVLVRQDSKWFRL